MEWSGDPRIMEWSGVDPRIMEWSGVSQHPKVAEMCGGKSIIQDTVYIMLHDEKGNVMFTT